MALFHLSVKIVGRQGGKRAEKRAAQRRVRISSTNTVAAAAYRSGQELYDERTGSTYRYPRADRVTHSEIALPAGAPAWAADRAALWNSVEMTERRKDSQLARDIEISLPVELDLEQQRQLVCDWVAATFTPSGAAVDIAIHHDKAQRNPHAHLIASMRSIGPDGWSKQKLRHWEEQSTVSEWRASWADHVNQALERAGHEARVDHRSYAEQDAHLPEELRREPTRKVGPWAKGRDRELENRQIHERNRSRLQKIRDLANRAAAPVRQAVETVKAALSPQPAPDPLASLSPLELARRYNQLVAQETRIRAAAAGVPIEQFDALSYEDQVALSGGAGLSSQDAKLLDQLEQRLIPILSASRSDTPSRTAQAAPVAEAKSAARPAPQAPVPSPAQPPLAAEPELTDEEKRTLAKQGRIVLAPDGSWAPVRGSGLGRG